MLFTAAKAVARRFFAPLSIMYTQSDILSFDFADFLNIDTVHPYLYEFNRQHETQTLGNIRRNLQKFTKNPEANFEITCNTLSQLKFFCQLISCFYVILSTIDIFKSLEVNHWKAEDYIMQNIDSSFEIFKPVTGQITYQSLPREQIVKTSENIQELNSIKKSGTNKKLLIGATAAAALAAITVAGILIYKNRSAKAIKAAKEALSDTVNSNIDLAKEALNNTANSKIDLAKEVDKLVLSTNNHYSGFIDNIITKDGLVIKTKDTEKSLRQAVGLNNGFACNGAYKNVGITKEGMPYVRTFIPEFGDKMGAAYKDGNTFLAQVALTSPDGEFSAAQKKLIALTAQGGSLNSPNSPFGAAKPLGKLTDDTHREFIAQNFKLENVFDLIQKWGKDIDVNDANTVNLFNNLEKLKPGQYIDTATGIIKDIKLN